MKKIRVLLANRPRIMREVIRSMIERQEDMEVVGEVLNPLDLFVAVRDTQSNAVVLALKDSEKPGLRSHLIAEYPDLTIVGLPSEGETAFVERLWWILDPSEAKILSALRHAVRPPWSAEGGMKA